MRHIKQRLSIVLILTGLLAAGLPAQSNASSASLMPTTATSNLLNGDVVSLDVAIDFSDMHGTLGGGFDVRWDPTALGFLGLTSAGLGDPAFRRDPDILNGLLESWAVADFSGIISGQVGSMQFEVLPSMGLSTIIAVAPTNGIGGPWVSLVESITILHPDYNSIELTRVIPVPAAAWLFGSALIGLIGLIGFSKKRKAT